MIERFYSISHLSTQQLRDLYATYRTRGWVESAYYALTPDDVNPPVLTDAEILLNINAEDENNYFVFMLDHEDEDDGVMIGFGMNYYPDFGVYLHLPPELLDELVEKYLLTNSHETENLTWTEYLAGERLKIALN